jgi:ABC-type polysaccharide/polyol phosphate export permease
VIGGGQREPGAFVDLVVEMVRRELKVRYRRSAFGFLWTMLQPLMMMLVLHIVFSTVFRFNIANYPVYVLAGVLFWNFFQQSIVTTMNSLRSNAGLIQKVPVPLMVFPLAVVLSGVVNLGFALVPLAGLLLVTGHPFTPALFFVPVAVLLAALFTLGAGLLLAPLAVFFYDVVEMVGVVLTALFYLTPIVYPMAILPERWRWAVRFNPLRSILEVFRDPIFYGKIPPLSHLSVALLVAVIALGVGAFAFWRGRDRIAFYV